MSSSSVRGLRSKHTLLVDDDRLMTGHCRGCANRLSECRTGCIRCQCSERCNLIYCVARIRGELRVCSAMRDSAESARGFVCHNQFEEAGCVEECTCRACKRRQKRARSKKTAATAAAASKQLTSASVDAFALAAAAASAGAGGVSMHVAGGSPVASVSSASSGATTTTDVSHLSLVASAAAAVEAEEYARTAQTTSKRSRREDRRVRVFSRSFSSAAAGVVVALRTESRRTRLVGGDDSDAEDAAASETQELAWRAFLTDVRSALGISTEATIRVVDERGCEYVGLDAVRDGDSLWVEDCVSSIASAAAAATGVVLPVTIARGGAGGDSAWRASSSSYATSREATEAELAVRAADMLSVMLANASSAARVAGATWGSSFDDAESRLQFGEGTASAASFLEEAFGVNEASGIAATARLSDEALSALAAEALEFEDDDALRRLDHDGVHGGETREDRAREIRQDAAGASGFGQQQSKLHDDGRITLPDPRPRPPPFPSWGPCVFAALAIRTMAVTSSKESAATAAPPRMHESVQRVLTGVAHAAASRALKSSALLLLCARALDGRLYEASSASVDAATLKGATCVSAAA
uniref:Uncharacterized protein n=1 Tax=Bicosoecida sp. CB-2014 TaxID=1486930 RepID=A0A7S1GC26_9STRA